MGLMAKPTDFGETMYTWGVGEGNYVVLPLLWPVDRPRCRWAGGGPRDQPAEAGASANLWQRCAHGARSGQRLLIADRYSETVDSILYDSADGYAQARLLYLQYRQFELGQSPADELFVIPMPSNLDKVRSSFLI